jgi:hypothetical protein
MKNQTQFRFVFLLSLVAYVSCLPPANGIEINVTYSGVGNPNTELRPANDPTGSRLVDIVGMAADYWETVIGDSGTFDINIEWNDRPLSNLGTAYGSVSGSNRAISFNGNQPWFLDDAGAGALDNSEFNLGFLDDRQRLYQDTAPADQAAWFRGTVPGSLERAAVGNTNFSNPDASDFDLFTVALHEIAHHLSAAGAGAGDGFWDFDPSLIGGNAVGVTVATGDDGPDTAHIALPDTILFPTIANGQRRLPSVADVLAVAGARGWTDIDLPRKDFIGGTSWHTSGNWIGNRIPGSSDDVYLRNTDALTTVDLTAIARAQNLHLGERTWLRTGDNGLTVGPTSGGILLIDGADSDTTLFVESGGSVQAGDVMIRNRGTLEMEGGTLSVLSGDILNADTNSQIRGYGQVGLFGGNRIINRGVIAADGGTLTFLGGNQSDAFDLRDPNGVILAEDGDIEFLAGGTSVGLNGLQGTMFIVDRRVTFAELFALETTGTIQVGGTGTSRLVAPQATLSGQVNVLPGADFEFDGALRTNAATDFFLQDAASKMTVNGTSELVLGTIRGEGTFAPNGDFNVPFVAGITNNPTISTRVFDWDGPGGDVTTTVTSGNRLTIASEQLDVVASNGHDGTINIESEARVDILTAPLRVDNRLFMGVLSELRINDALEIAPGARLDGERLVSISGTSGGPTHRVWNRGEMWFGGSIDVATELQNDGSFDLFRLDAGTVSLDGDYVQSTTGSIIFDLIDTSLDQVDRLGVTGLADLAGGLEIFPGSVSAGDEVTLISAASGIFGSFDSVNVVALAPGLDWSIDYLANEVVFRLFNDSTLIDFNGDGSLDCVDIDQLTAEIAAGTNGASFDLTADGVVNIADLDVWLSDAAIANGLGSSYLYGDANLDGSVNGADFVIWNSSKFTSDTAWCAGNFNGDGAVDGADFVIWNSNKFMTSDTITARHSSHAALQAVPEPNAHYIVLSMLSWIMVSTRRK